MTTRAIMASRADADDEVASEALSAATRCDDGERERERTRGR